MQWLILNEKEVYANVHPADISRKRVTAIRYVLSYIIDNINRLGYKLLGMTDGNGNFSQSVHALKLNTTIREFLKEATIRRLATKDHGEVITLESPSSNMYTTITKSLMDQTDVRSVGKDRNHQYDKSNNLHPSNLTRCRVDGIDGHSPSGVTQINPLGCDMSRDTALNIHDWLKPIEDKLAEDLKGDF